MMFLKQCNHHESSTAASPACAAVAAGGGGTARSLIHTFIPHFSPSSTGRPACRTRASTPPPPSMLYLLLVTTGPRGAARHATQRRVTHHMTPWPTTGANATPRAPRCGNQVQPPAAGCRRYINTDTRRWPPAAILSLKPGSAGLNQSLWRRYLAGVSVMVHWHVKTRRVTPGTCCSARTAPSRTAPRGSLQRQLEDRGYKRDGVKGRGTSDLCQAGADYCDAGMATGQTA
jgi:hypothetical protein